MKSEAWRRAEPGKPRGRRIITCVVDYTVNPDQIRAFERFAARWMSLVAQNGGLHHGYLLPAEAASDKALARFSFPSLALYEGYWAKFGSDPEFLAADRIRDESGCIPRYERTFMRPLLPESAAVQASRPPTGAF